MRRSGSGIAVLARIGFRNLARNRRRSGLTVAGVAFAVLLVGLSAALQDGGYAMQRQISTDLLTGHLQISHPQWPAEMNVDQLITGASAVSGRLSALPGVRSVTSRVQVSALFSVGERSGAGLLLGLDIVRESAHTGLLRRLQDGRLPEAPGEIIVGAGLARHLRVVPGDEIVILGADPQGGVVALGLQLTGIIASGIAELDRTLAIMPLHALSDALSLDDAVHVIVVRTDTPLAAIPMADRVRLAAGPDLLVRTWQDVLPEIEQSIALDRLSGYVFFGLVLFLVAFSVANTFVMVVFERTREIGMLRSLGMRAWQIIGLFQMEAIALWLVGIVVGILVTVPLMLWLRDDGLYLGAALEATLTQMYMPSRMYAEISPRSLYVAPLVLLFATQLAALLPSLRVRRILPADAMRHQA